MLVFSGGDRAVFLSGCLNIYIKGKYSFFLAKCNPFVRFLGEKR